MGGQGNAKVKPRHPDRLFLEYQDDWIDDMNRLKLMEKGRQIGLSWSTAQGTVERTSHRDARFDQWVSSRDELQARLFIEDCKKFGNMLNAGMQDLGLAVIDEKTRASAYVLQFINGRRIHSMSSNPDAQAGKRGGRVLDEFALHPDPRKLYAIAYPGITWGGQLEIISTHRGSANFFNELVEDVKHRGNPKGFSLHTVSLQTALDQGFLFKLQSVIHVDDPIMAMDEAEYFDFIKSGCASEEQFLQEYMCVPADDEGAFLSYDMIAGCEYRATEKWEYSFGDLERNELYMGVDVGRAHDLTVIWILERVLGMLFTRKVICMQNEKFSAQEAVIYEWLDRPQILRACFDDTGLGMQLAERAVEKYGEYRVEPVRFTGPVKEQLAYPVRAAFEDKSIRIPRDDKVRADLRGIRKTTTAAGNLRFEADSGPDGHSDRFWALALAIEAASSPAADTQILSGSTRETATLFGGIEMSDGIWIDPDRFMSFEDLAGRGQLAEEIASRQAAWDWSGMIGLLPDPDPILRKMGSGDEVLESLTADGHLCSVVQQRKLGTLKKEFRWKPGVAKEGENPSAAATVLRDRLVEDLKQVDLYNLISGLLDAPLYGMTPVEIYWRPASSHLAIVDLSVKPARWFGFDEENRPRFVSMHNQLDGEKLPYGKFVIARHFPTYDNPYGLRLLSRCFWPVAFKKGGIKFWVTLAEKYGMPFMVGQYRPGATGTEQEKMLASLSKMVRDAVAVIPQGGTVQILETGKGGGRAEIHSGLKSAMDAEMSKVIIGQTLTAEVGDKGSYAAGKVHEDVLEDFRQGDQKLVASSMGEIARIYGLVNAPGVPAPVFCWFEEDEPKKEFSERDSTLCGTPGVRFKKPYYVRTYGFKEDEFDLVDRQNEDGRSDGKPENEFSSPRQRRFTADQQALEDLADDGVAGGVDALADNEKKILAAIESAGSYEEAMTAILDIYPAMTTAGLEELMERTLLASELFGRYTAQHGRKARP